MNNVLSVFLRLFNAISQKIKQPTIFKGDFWLTEEIIKEIAEYAIKNCEEKEGEYVATFSMQELRGAINHEEDDAYSTIRAIAKKMCNIKGVIEKNGTKTVFSVFLSARAETIDTGMQLNFTLNPLCFSETQDLSKR